MWIRCKTVECFDVDTGLQLHAGEKMRMANGAIQMAFSNIKVVKSKMYRVDAHILDTVFVLN